MLEKLVKFIGKSVRNIVEREDERYCFRLHKNRVYYVRETLVKKSTNVRSFWYCAAACAPARWNVSKAVSAQGCTQHGITCCTRLHSIQAVKHAAALMQVARDKLAMLGVQLGRMTSHKGTFRLGIGCIDLLAQYAKYKVRAPSAARFHVCACPVSRLFISGALYSV